MEDRETPHGAFMCTDVEQLGMTQSVMAAVPYIASGSGHTQFTQFQAT
jgi:hypothetical protein